MHGPRFLIATANSTFGNKEYIVEVGAPKQPIKAVFRESCDHDVDWTGDGAGLRNFRQPFFRSACACSRSEDRSGYAGVAGFSPEDEPIKEVAVLEQIESLCVTVNEMVGQLEDSFQIGAGLPAEAFRSPGDRLGTVRGELAHLFGMSD